MADWLLRFDGLFEPRYQPRGIATYGFTLDHGRERIGTGKGLLVGPAEGGSANSRAPDGTRSPHRADAAVAEFGALLHGLALVEERKRDACALRIEGDSRLVIETVAGRWNLTSERLVPLRDIARATLARIPGEKTLAKVGREANAEADALSREAYHEAADAHPEWGLGRHAKSARKPRARPPPDL